MRRFLLAIMFLVLLSNVSFASNTGWHQKKEYRNDLDSSVTIEMTYYAEEYIEQLIQEEASKNLWTADEVENYKYTLLKTLKLDEFIPVFVSFKNNGPAIRLAPFDDQIDLYVGSKRYKPAEYDRRFNFKISDSRDGFVYFPRYDEETGQPILKKGMIKVILRDTATPVTMGKRVEFLWDIRNDNPGKALSTGKAADRLELDRLIIRLGNLKGQRAEIQKQLDELDTELSTIQSRITELQSN
ncbi:hypothetical protein [Dethiosulfovibrio salsuginis]|uniref:Uncharacterized protein n=1 Tax=Dethiosulfovibrio salsuginis TaxID=561720 RepID=A0A1X7K6I9_9BACT|nr:hypothetical protein [Dethiosulfovibrio salsuginis]SMG35968.1 hypothetical protein SAMN06275492_1216 [Dethiosulfovibrio salsuginis]